MPGLKDITEIRASKEIPDEVKDLMITVISQMQIAEAQVVGNIELAYRRGLHVGMELKNEKDK